MSEEGQEVQGKISPEVTSRDLLTKWVTAVNLMPPLQIFLAKSVILTNLICIVHIIFVIVQTP